MKRLLECGVIAAFLLIYSGTGYGQDRAWKYYRYDLARTARYPFRSEVRSGPPLVQQWFLPRANFGSLLLTGDVNGDGELELVTGDGTTIVVCDQNGAELWREPVSCLWGPALCLGDVDGDGVPEIIAGIRTYAGSYELKLLVYDGFGSLLGEISRMGGYIWNGSSEAWAPNGYERGMEPMTVLEQHGKRKILVKYETGYGCEPRGVGLFDYESGVEEWYYDVGPAVQSSAAGDVDCDGEIEVFPTAATVHNGAWGYGFLGNGTYTTDTKLWTIVIDENGNEEYSDDFGGAHEHCRIDFCMADLDRNGAPELLCFEGKDQYYPGIAQIHLRDGTTGEILRTYDAFRDELWIWAVGDVDGDGFDEIVASNWWWSSHSVIYILDHNLQPLLVVSDRGKVAAINDVDGDGRQEIVTYDGARLRILRGDATELCSYAVDAPVRMPTALIICDLDGDGMNEIMFPTDNGTMNLELTPMVIPVAVDIKPGSCPNPINVSGGGVIPVAVLGADDFDVMGIDLMTIELEGVAPIRSGFEDVATPFTGELCDCWTEGPDGYDDLTLKFDKQEILDALGEVEDGDEIELTLTGNLLDGTEMTGSDCVVIIKRGDAGEQYRGIISGGPSVLSLSQNSPNPFARSTLIAFNIPSEGHITLKVYDAGGSLVETLVDEEREAGSHNVSWDRQGLESGVYFCRLSAAGQTLCRKMVVVE